VKLLGLFGVPRSDSAPGNCGPSLRPCLISHVLLLVDDGIIPLQHQAPLILIKAVNSVAARPQATKCIANFVVSAIVRTS